MKSPAELYMWNLRDRNGRVIHVTDRVRFGDGDTGVVESFEHGFTDCVNIRRDGHGLTAREPESLEVIDA